MATQETIADMVKSMATLWKFPSQDLAQTARVYHSALRDLSDQDIENAAAAVYASWEKSSPPKPADIIRIAKELRPSPPRQPVAKLPEWSGPTDEERQVMLEKFQDWKAEIHQMKGASEL